MKMKHDEHDMGDNVISDSEVPDQSEATDVRLGMVFGMGKKPLARGPEPEEGPGFLARNNVFDRF